MVIDSFCKQSPARKMIDGARDVINFADTLYDEIRDH